MRRKLLCLLLCAALALTACAGRQDSPEEPAKEPAAPPRDIVLGVLAALGAERWEELAEEDREFYLTQLYGLEESSWSDAAICRAGGAEAMEIAVIRLAEEADAEAAAEKLEAYRDERQGAFTGYAPEQEAIVARSRTAVWGPCAALLICDDPEGAERAFSALASGELAPPEELVPAGEPEPEPEIEPEPPEDEEESDYPEIVLVPYEKDPDNPRPIRQPGRVPFVAPNKEDMTLWDTTNILAVWNGGEADLTQEEQTVLDAASALLAELVTEEMSPYQRERAVYGWLTANVAYDQRHYDPISGAPRESYTPYNPLTEGQGVCLGFASAFQLLMDMCGVECITVVGAAYGSRDDHAWNMVRLDGEWYCADPTWDCGVSQHRWRFFNVTSDAMARSNHQWDYGTVPEAEAEDGGVRAAR